MNAAFRLFADSAGGESMRRLRFLPDRRAAERP
jgi:hypothetical protein